MKVKSILMVAAISVAAGALAEPLGNLNRNSEVVIPSELSPQLDTKAGVTTNRFSSRGVGDGFNLAVNASGWAEAVSYPTNTLSGRFTNSEGLTLTDAPCLTFDGVGDYARVALPGIESNYFGECTISAWVKFDDLSATRVVWALGNDGYRVFASTDGGTNVFKLNNGSIPYGFEVPENEWLNIRATYEADASCTKFEVLNKGFEWTGDIEPATNFAPGGDSDKGFTIGCRFQNGSPGVFLAGSIADVTVSGPTQYEYPPEFTWVPAHDLGLYWNGSAWDTTFGIMSHRIESTNYFYISTSGNDSNNGLAPGTAKASMDSVHAAVNSSGFADACVIIQDGTYADKWGNTTPVTVPIEYIGQGSPVFASSSDVASAGGSEYLFMANVSFSGGGQALTLNEHAFNDIAYFVNCNFDDSAGNGLRAIRDGEIYVVNCQAENNLADGLNYHEATTGSPNVFEYLCRGINNGDSDSDNGSTMHEVSQSIRVQGIYTGNWRNIHDIQGTKNILLSCQMNDSQGSTGENSFNLGCGSSSGGDTTFTWARNCTYGGDVVVDLYIGPTGDLVIDDSSVTSVSNYPGGVLTYTNMFFANDISVPCQEMSGTALYDLQENSDLTITVNSSIGAIRGTGVPYSYSHLYGSTRFYDGAEYISVPNVGGAPLFIPASSIITDSYRPGLPHNGDQYSLVFHGDSYTFEDLGRNSSFDRVFSHPGPVAGKDEVISYDSVLTAEEYTDLKLYLQD